MRVTTLENNRIVQPEGKQWRKENEEVPCTKVTASLGHEVYIIKCEQAKR